jgi:hypothetical protein
MERIEVCNVWKCQCYVDLKGGHQLCPMCNGHGAKFLNASFKQRHFTVIWCKLCIGEGKVDWIRAINKQFPINPSGDPYRIITKDIKMRCTGPKHCKKQLKRIWMNNKRFCNPYYETYVHGKEL